QGDFVSKIHGNGFVKSARSTGTVLAIEIETGESSSYFSNIRDHIYNYFMDRGVIIRPLGNVLYLVPPFCITKEELKGVHNMIVDFLDSLSVKQE
ncbi:MAG: aminotransferase class III-fold pyridoxal phosphate-dependent enzyme, partial [Flavobacteriales bacterium]|nr:aminotransferase class III-fold pyridoxal phosphate-dependent enzyme [Flavobacteriales bacterium]